MPAGLQEISSLGGSSPVLTYLFNVASETVDLVQLMGAGIKDLEGSVDLELELFIFFPSFDLALLGARCATFFTMAEVQGTTQETNLDSIPR